MKALHAEQRDIIARILLKADWSCIDLDIATHLTGYPRDFVASSARLSPSSFTYRT